MRSAIQVIMILAIGLCSFVFTHRVDAAPSAFSLISPQEGESVFTKVLLDWEDSADTKELTYTLFLSKGNNIFGDSDDIDPINGITGSCYILENMIDDNSTYYWKVQAVNETGETSETKEVRHFKTDNNANPVPAWIGGHVYTSFQQSLIPVAYINIIISLWGKNFSSKTDTKGYCGIELNPNSPTNPGAEEPITLEVGCRPQPVEATIAYGEKREKDVTLEFDGIGDINGDCCYDLKDAVSALQILTGGQPSAVNNQGFPNEDSKIGLSELIYILQRVSDPSPCATNSVQK